MLIKNKNFKSDFVLFDNVQADEDQEDPDERYDPDSDMDIVDER